MDNTEDDNPPVGTREGDTQNSAFEGVPVKLEDDPIKLEDDGEDADPYLRLRLCILSFLIVVFLVQDLRAIFLVNDGPAITATDAPEQRGSMNRVVVDELAYQENIKGLYPGLRKKKTRNNSWEKQNTKTKPNADKMLAKKFRENKDFYRKDKARTAGSDVDVFHDNVRSLTSDNYEEVLSLNEYVFVLFYAPWCVYSQRVAPTWADFAQESTAKDAGFEVVKVDCMSQAQVCAEQQIVAYPTLRWFHNGQRDGDEGGWRDYKFERDVKSFMEYSCRKMGQKCEEPSSNRLMSPGMEDDEQTLSDKERLERLAPVPTLLREKERLAPVPTLLEKEHDVFQDNVVISLTLENFEEVLSSNEYVFVFFYTKWCTWCKNMAPTWEDFALESKAKDAGFDVVKVDCTSQPDICVKQNIMAYPTLRWFHNEQRDDGGDFKDRRTVKNFLAFACSKMGQNCKLGLQWSGLEKI